MNKIDLLGEIRSLKAITNVIILTHNIDFLFLQTLVLNALSRCGNPRITVFADAQCAHQSFSTQHSLVESLGFRYRVVPVQMPAHFSFHPKAILLASPERANLLVGSGNLTFGGWRDNLEIWTRFETAVDANTPFLQFRQYLNDILSGIPMADAAAEEIDDAFDHPWIDVGPTADSASPVLVGRAGSGAPLLQRLLAHAGEGAVDALYICCPYFDESGTGLRRLLEALRPSEATILYQPRGSTLTRAAHGSNPGVTLQHVTFERPGLESTVREAFIHAKFYGIVREDTAWILCGSANCSIAAMTLEGPAGNAELMIVLRLPADEFRTHWVADLRMLTEPAIPPDVIEKPEDLVQASLYVLAARLEDGVLRVAYAPPQVQVLTVRLDGKEALAFAQVGDGELTIDQPGDCRRVSITGEANGEALESNVAWVDHEAALRASRANHPAMDAMRDRATGGMWDANAWADVMTVFCRHLAGNSAPQGTQSTRVRRNSRSNKDEVARYSYADIFNPGYELPKMDLAAFDSDFGADTTNAALLAWVLHWFAGQSSAPPTRNGEENQDDRLRLRQRAKRNDKRLPPADRARLVKLLHSACNSLTRPEYCSSRPAGELRLDLSLTAVLLGTGLRERWIDQLDYFETTEKIWGSLFLNGGPTAPKGWVHERASDPNTGAAFRRDFKHPMLSASLIGWALTMPRSMRTQEAARFQFTVAFAVARNEWLWWGGDPEEIAIGLQTFMRGAGPLNISSQDLQDAWLEIVQRGRAFAELEQAMNQVRPGPLFEQMKCSRVEIGDLLWQGKSGYCVALRAADRRGAWDVSVDWIQSPQNTSKVAPDATIPVQAVLNEDLLSQQTGFGTAQTAVVQRLLHQLRQAYKPAIKLNI